MYSYVLNNPLNAIDPSGLDCVYLNDDGTQVESMDPDSDANFCSQDGGFWVDQHANAASFHNYGNGQSTIQNTNGVTYMLCTGGGDECSHPPDFNRARPRNDAVADDWLGDGLIGSVAGGVVGVGRGVIGGLIETAGTETVTGAVTGASSVTGGEAAAQLTGGIIDKTVQTAAGPLRIWAKVEAEGSTAVVKEVLVYPADNTGRIEVSTTEAMRGFRAVLRELKEQGFTDFRMEPQHRKFGANAGGYSAPVSGKL